MAKSEMKQAIEDYLYYLPEGTQFTTKDVINAIAPRIKANPLEVGTLLNHTKFDIHKLPARRPVSYIKYSNNYRGRHDYYV